MSGIIDSIKSAFHTTPHTAPRVKHVKKILLAVTSATVQMPDHRSGYFWGELLHPAEVFMEHGWDFDIVSENGQATPDEASIDKMASAADKRKWEDKEFPLHKKLAAIRSASSVNPADYTAIYFAGGHACCEDLPRAQGLKKLVAQIYEAGGVVGADCHGIAIFEGLKLSNGQNILQGKEVTGFSRKGEEDMKVMEWMRQHKYSTMQEIVENAGGKWNEASNPMADYTLVSQRVCTGMNPASAASVAKHMLTFLPSTDEYAPQEMINRVVADSQQKGSSLVANQDKARAEALDESERLKQQRDYTAAAGTRV